MFGAIFNDMIQCGDQRLCTFKGKTFLTGKFLVNKLLKINGFCQVFQDVLFLFPAEGWRIPAAFHFAF